MKKKNASLPALRGGQLEKAPKAASAFVSRKSLAPVEGVIVKTMSPMLKPANWPQVDGENAVLVGRMTKFFKTGEFKRMVGKKEEIVVGTGVEIIPEGAPVGVSLPVTATLRTGLAVDGDGADAKSEFLGRIVEVELLGKVPSKKGQDAWNFLVAIYPGKKE
jgi:hypothetical protein